MLSCKIWFVITGVAVTWGTNDTLIINNLSYAYWITWHKQVPLFTLTIGESTVHLITSPVNWGNWLDILETVIICKYIFISRSDPCVQVDCDYAVSWRDAKLVLGGIWCLAQGHFRNTFAERWTETTLLDSVWICEHFYKLISLHFFKY